MAVFLINICKFNGCGITFPSLGDLIQHIEDTHIDYDPKVVEQKEQAQPACLPLSYVLRFISDDARKGAPFIAANTAGVDLKRKLAIKHHSYSMSSSNRSNTPTGSEMDEDEMVVSESEDSNDSWTTEEFSSEFIMRYGSRHSGTGSNGTPGNEKPFACPVPGCKKRYKNVNGIKYHSKNGHKKDGKVRKGYKCHCGKSYKTAQGLKNHALATHNSPPDNVLTTQQVVACTNGNGSNSGGLIMQRSTSPSQSLGSLSPSSISNMSSSASSCHGGGSGSLSNTSMLQQLTSSVVSGVTGIAVSAGTVSSSAGNQPPQHHSQYSLTTNGASTTLQHTASATTGAVTAATGNSNSLIRSTIGLVSIKTNNAVATTAATSAGTRTSAAAAAATNLLAANATASKILKLATSAAAAAAASNANNVDIAQQHKLQQPSIVSTLVGNNNVAEHTINNSNNTGNIAKQQHQQLKLQQQLTQQTTTQTSNNTALPTLTPTKIALPNNYVNLGILTPASTPAKNITTTAHTLTFAQQQQQPQTISNGNMLQQQQKMTTVATTIANSKPNSNKIVVLEQTNGQQPTEQTQHLPLTPISPSNTNNMPTASVNVQAKNVANALLASLQQKSKQNIIGTLQLSNGASAAVVSMSNGNAIGNIISTTANTTNTNTGIVNNGLTKTVSLTPLANVANNNNNNTNQNASILANAIVNANNGGVSVASTATTATSNSVSAVGSVVNVIAVGDPIGSVSVGVVSDET